MRIDCIIIWGHGLKYFDDILREIRENKSFKVLRIQRYKPKNLKKFVKEVYSYDYAPFWHLKEKTKYLLKTPNEVCFIFFENLHPDEDYLDVGYFRHKESITLKKFKEGLRDKYNPHKNYQRTHNHVIHATDSQEQTKSILKYLGFDKGLDTFTKYSKCINNPYYIKNLHKLNIFNINCSELYCNVVEGDAWDNYKIITKNVYDSPQYIGLMGDMKTYEAYIDKFLGGPLTEDYNVNRYKRLSKEFKYLESPYATSYVIVKNVQGRLIIQDGLHRACNHIKQGYEKITICETK
jgi:hypothetical protein